MKRPARPSRNQNSEYLPQRRKENLTVISTEREKSFLDPSLSLGMTGLGPSLGALAREKVSFANRWGAKFARTAKTLNYSNKGHQEAELIILPSRWS
jgi:hypothetical protein